MGNGLKKVAAEHGGLTVKSGSSTVHYGATGRKRKSGPQPAAKKKPEPSIAAAAVLRIEANFGQLSATPEMQQLQQLSDEQIGAAWAHLQAWVKANQPLLPPLSRIGYAAGLTRAQACSLMLPGSSYRAAKTLEKLAMLQILLKKHAYHPLS